MTLAELIASKLAELVGRTTGDYELKKKIRKSNMTIETITEKVHEYMYDRLNNSKNSNDGRGRQHVQERLYKQKWSEKSSYEKSRRNRTFKKQITNINDVPNAASRTGQDSIPAHQNSQSVEHYKRRGLYEKM